jgi:hypothetical protein
MKSICITAFPKKASQIKAIEALMDAFEIKYQIDQADHTPYSKEFSKKILRGKKEIEQKQTTAMPIQDFKALCKLS